MQMKRRMLMKNKLLAAVVLALLAGLCFPQEKPDGPALTKEETREVLEKSHRAALKEVSARSAARADGLTQLSDEALEEELRKAAPAPMPEGPAVEWDVVYAEPRALTVEEKLVTPGQVVTPGEIMEAAPEGSVSELNHVQLHGIVLKIIEARTKFNKEIVKFAKEQNGLNDLHEERIDALEAKLEECRCKKKKRRR